MTIRSRFKEGTYYARNRARILARQNRKYRKNSARKQQIGPLWKKLKQQPWFDALKRAKKRATKRKRKFDLTPQWATEHWNGRCAVTDIEFIPGKGQAGLFSASLDRIDNDQDYTQTNCRFVLNAVNMLKSTGTDVDMVRIARAIVSNAAP